MSSQQQPPTSSEKQSETPNWKAAALEIAKQKQELELLTGMLGQKALKDQIKQRKKMIEAEESAAAESMGWKVDDEESDAVEINALGNVTVNEPPTPQPTQPAPKRSLLPIALTAAAGLLGGPALGVATHHLLKSEPVSPVVDQADETVSIGLKRLSDLVTE